ncbi:UDP-N-acetylmuramoyl-L-alanyl-D-glutamate--2,6-diaminopimelate ligase [Clostridium aminobutyricum]|uniref:UDP-N-acetylmuramoyl-L-alanyl-D-glutamate--2, 6-diaminopimelate ligase n=1 Tax=Clostridium aminobutyricum TaxID=33953 RepID=A0A939IGZ9_CLOAM|nr:UDP-N-acetylmuramoyl-L-alanyl-D-glutamate--2,6-diaminopimelate ligase [Clostridium aminobutyricum]
MTITVFGITGTNGKTTVSYMLKSILEEDGKKCGLVGTISHKIGNNEYEAINTTPGKDTLKKYFHEMKEQDISTCIMEVSSHALQQGRIDETTIHYAGFTNLTQDHLDYHVTMEDYYKAKEKLFLITQRGMTINIDDSYGKRLYETMQNRRKNNWEEYPPDIQSYSLEDSNADYFAEIVENSIRGIQIQVYEKGESWGIVNIGLPGKTSAYNGLLALAMARQTGIERNKIVNGLYKLPRVPGRFQRVDNSYGMDIVIDFAHTPDALENLLKTANSIKKERLICVFGCGGNRDAGKRSLMGKIAGQYSDYCIITSDNPRREAPEDIAAAIEEGIYDTGCQYSILLDRYQAIKRAIQIYKNGDIIVIAGKGHEKYQIIGDRKMPFDDEKVVQELMNKG